MSTADAPSLPSEHGSLAVSSPGSCFPPSLDDRRVPSPLLEGQQMPRATAEAVQLP